MFTSIEEQVIKKEKEGERKRGGNRGKDRGTAEKKKQKNIHLIHQFKCTPLGLLDDQS